MFGFFLLAGDLALRLPANESYLSVSSASRLRPREGRTQEREQKRREQCNEATTATGGAQIEVSDEEEQKTQKTEEARG